MHQSRFRKALDFLYNFSDPKVDRKGNAPPFILDLRRLLALVNDQVNSSEWVHYCRQGDDGPQPGQPCCTSDVESRAKVSKVVAHCLYGRAETAPGEGKWTYLLSSFKRSILRKLVHGVGVIKRSMFPTYQKKRRNPANGPAVDEEADETLVNTIRMEKTCDYMAAEGTFHQLGVQVIIHAITDTLFFKLLGGADRQEAPCTIHELLAKDSSHITKVIRELYDVLLSGSNDPDHPVWCLTHLLGAPMRDQGFRKYCLGQTLRMLTTIHRRYAVKYSSWPFLCIACTATAGRTRSERDSQRLSAPVLRIVWTCMRGGFELCSPLMPRCCPGGLAHVSRQVLALCEWSPTLASGCMLFSGAHPGRPLPLAPSASLRRRHLWGKPKQCMLSAAVSRRLRSRV